MGELLQRPKLDSAASVDVLGLFGFLNAKSRPGKRCKDLARDHRGMMFRVEPCQLT